MCPSCNLVLNIPLNIPYQVLIIYHIKPLMAYYSYILIYDISMELCRDFEVIFVMFSMTIMVFGYLKHNLIKAEKTELNLL